MKFYIAILVGFLCVSASAFGALSADDYEKLNTMFKESETRMKNHVSQEIAREIAEVRVEIAKVNAEIAKVNAEIRRVDSRIDETNKRIDTESQVVRDRFGDLNNRLNIILGLLGALIAVVIGLPLLRERKKEREQDEQLAAQQAVIEKQQEQLAAQQVLIEKQQEQLAAQQQKLDVQQQEMAAVREELATLKQQVPNPSATE